MNFSLRQLLVLTTLLCAYVAVASALPVSLSVIILALGTTLLPAFFLGGILYSRGNWRAFWCGAASCGTIPAMLVTWWIVVVVLGELDEMSALLFSFGDNFER